MRIPLDYYRILGLPLAASGEQLRQAYSDRIVQLPRREYSQAAIQSRKQLIEEAYVVLSDPKERKAYDQLYLAHAYGSGEGTQNATVALENRPPSDYIPDSQTLSIEVTQEELVGALLILQELGEYELVLKLSRPYLINQNGKVAGEEIYLATERSDIILTVALACLELGREQWQQAHYENAATSLETGAELLAREGLFSSVQAEIQADLYRLRPYRIMELLALPEQSSKERKQGLQLLQEVLDERGGIDGSGDDQSGLNIDDFLRFIQQLRNHLTVTEQHQLFETESKRPSAVATYLAVYAQIAKGFSQRQPALIRQAKQMLTRLGKRQDVHLEQALCALLLGQTEEATRALELSQEYEALAFIREYSQDSPDLLPGLCLYGERWLQNEVFPHFRDLAHHQASLKDYFANQQVQAYLEALPTEAENTYEWTGTSSQTSFPTPTTYPRYHSSSTTHSHPSQNHRTSTSGVTETQNLENLERTRFSQPSSTTFSGGNSKLGKPVTSLSQAERSIRKNHHHSNGAVRVSNVHSQSKTPPKRRRNASGSVRRMPAHRHTWTNSRHLVIPKAQVRLLLMVFASVASVFVLGFFTIKAFGWLTNFFFPGPSLQGEQLFVEINQPVIPIPDQNSKPLLPTGSLTKEAAQEVVQAWLSAKAAALGVEHDIGSLEQILVGSALTQWQLIARQEKAKNRHRQYEHSLKVEAIDTKPTDRNYAAVEAAVNEVARFYERGQLNQQKSYDETVRVKYDLVFVNGSWRIRDMSVLSQINTTD